MIRDVYCGSWVQDPDLSILDPGSRSQKAPDPGSATCLVGTVDALKQHKRIWVLFPFMSRLIFPKPSLFSMLASAGSFEKKTVFEPLPLNIDALILSWRPFGLRISIG
jgi:hypothetical protein